MLGELEKRRRARWQRCATGQVLAGGKVFPASRQGAGGTVIAMSAVAFAPSVASGARCLRELAGGA
jgi:hypothetical protein